MEEHISKFNSHGEDYVKTLNSLKEALTEHTKGVHNAISVTQEESRIHRDMTENAYQKRTIEEKKLQDMKDLHQKEINSHKEWEKQRDSQISLKNKEYSDVENRCEALDSKARALQAEVQEATAKSSYILSQLSPLDRSLSDKRGEESKLEEFLVGKKDELGKIVQDIESAKKELTQIQQDIAIKNARA